MSDGITILVSTGQCWQVEGNIISKHVAWFNDTKPFQAGWYRIKYVTGAFRFNVAYGWGVSTNWYLVTQKGGEVDLLQLPSVPNPGGPSIPSGKFAGPGYDTEEAARNAALLVGSRDFYHTGGPLGIQLHDNPYTDNIHGSPDPTWSLCLLREQVSTDASCQNLQLYSTGVSIGGPVLGALADPNWELYQSIDPLNPGPTAFVSNDPLPSVWVPNDSQSKWLSPRTVGAYACPIGTYIYRYSLDLTSIDISTVQITGSWAADDSGTDILVNGVSTGQTSLGYTSLTPFSISVDNLIQGVNTFDFVVKNGTSGLNPTGVRVLWTGVGCLSVSSGVSSISSGLSASSGVSEQTSSASSVPCTPETPQTGLLKASYKSLLDSLSPNPGGFGFIFTPGTYLTNQGVDNILSGDVTFVSNSLTFTCSNVSLNDIPQQAIKFNISQDFLDSFCLEIKGSKGSKGATGDKGPQGKHGTGDGPQGEVGPAGVDATSIDTFTDITITDVSEIYDTAVVGLNLDPTTSVLEVIKAKMAVPESDKPAQKVYATPIYRDITFDSPTSLDSWSLFAPSTDELAQTTQSSDVNIIKLPDGWSGAVAGVVPMKLSELVGQIVNYYDGQASDILSQWDREIRDFLDTKDKEARAIISDLAMELTEAEWSQPVDMCLDVDPSYCGDYVVTPGGGGGGGGSGGGGGGGATPCEGCTTFTWDTGTVYEPGHPNAGLNPNFVRTSQEAIVCVSGHDAIIFNAVSDDFVIITESSLSVTAITTDTGDVIVTIPLKSIIFRNTFGSISAPGIYSAKKTITDTSHTYVFKSGDAVLIPVNVINMESAGFTTRSWQTPITKAELEAKGWLTADGFFKFKVHHVVSGSGRCWINSLECIDDYSMYNTGQEAVTRGACDEDLHWLTGSQSFPIDLAKANVTEPPTWMAALPNTRWIGSRCDYGLTGDIIRTYRSTFYIGPNVDLTKLKVPIQIYGNSYINGLWINSTKKDTMVYTSLTLYDSDGIVAGVNTITIDVVESITGQPKPKYSGLLVKWGVPTDYD